jgi:hypothetical protein
LALALLPFLAATSAGGKNAFRTPPESWFSESFTKNLEFLGAIDFTVGAG